jgi:hypothetical protein
MNGRNNYELPMTNYFKDHNLKPNHRTDSPSERGWGESAVCEMTINSLKSNNPTPTLPFPKGEGEELISHKGAFGFFILAPRFIGVEKAHKPQILNGFKRFESASANIPPVSPLSQRGENPKNRKSVIDHDFYFRPIHRETCWERSLSGAEVSLSNVLAVHSSFIIYHSNVPPSLRPSISPSLHPPSLRPLVPSPFRPFVSSSLRLFVPSPSVLRPSVSPSLRPSIPNRLLPPLWERGGPGWGYSSLVTQKK